jgi:hypothetical protein
LVAIGAAPIAHARIEDESMRQGKAMRKSAISQVDPLDNEVRMNHFPEAPGNSLAPCGTWRSKEELPH